MERAVLAVQGFMKPGGKLCRKLAGPLPPPPVVEEGLVGNLV